MQDTYHNNYDLALHVWANPIFMMTSLMRMS